jgi:hypothetical protein
MQRQTINRCVAYPLKKWMGAEQDPFADDRNRAAILYSKSHKKPPKAKVFCIWLL